MGECVGICVCVRRFHGNLSGVCLVPGDREREGER